MKGIHINPNGMGTKPKKSMTPMMHDIGIDNMGMEVAPSKPLAAGGKSKKVYPSVHIDRPPKGLKIGDKVVMHGHVGGYNEDEYGATAKIKVKKIGLHTKQTKKPKGAV